MRRIDTQSTLFCLLVNVALVTLTGIYVNPTSVFPYIYQAILLLPANWLWGCLTIAFGGVVWVKSKLKGVQRRTLMESKRKNCRIFSFPPSAYSRRNFVVVLQRNGTKSHICLADCRNNSGAVGGNGVVASFLPSECAYGGRSYVCAPAFQARRRRGD